jgi:hypothetical protein
MAAEDSPEEPLMWENQIPPRWVVPQVVSLKWAELCMASKDSCGKANTCRKHWVTIHGCYGLFTEL